MDQRTASDVLSRLAFATEVLEGPSPATKSWTHAARVVRLLAGDLRELDARGELARTRGLGASSLAVVREVLAGREPAVLRELEARVPEGLFQMHRIKGLGPAKIRALHEGLGICTLGELEHACRENRLVSLPGFGAKTQSNVLAGIEQLRRAESILLRSRAEALMQPLLASLRARGVAAVPLGDLPRGKELVAGLELAVVGDRAVIDAVLAAQGAVLSDAARAEGSEAAPAEGAVREGTLDGAPITVREVQAETIGVVAVQRSADPAHVALLAARADSLGLTLSEEALLRDDVRVPCADEDALYAALGLCTTPPERREPGVPLVQLGKTQPRLVRLEDLRGALHNHTNESDGVGTLAEMRAAAEAMGLSYLGISDHSHTASYAGGLDAARLRAQVTVIASMEKGTCTLLSGVESDILPDGSLDYDDEVLAAVEVVVASIHRRHGLDREASTARIVAAARHPYTDVLGHPTGRLLLGRPPNDFDVEAMLDAAAASGCAVELNASPHRLDLCDAHCAMAKERGVLVSIGADAHAPGELSQLAYGIAIARRAGLGPEDVLNTRSLPELRAWLSARRVRALER